MKQLFLLILLSTFFLACSSYPIWMDDPTQNGQYRATIGQAPALANPSLQERLALLQAKANLSKQHRMDLNTTLTLEQNQTKSQIHTQSIHKSRGVVGVKILDRYRDKNGALFLWVVEP